VPGVETKFVAILGGQRAASPPSLGVREMLLGAWAEEREGGMRLLFVAAAILCSCAGTGCRATLSRCGWDALTYGEACYSWLREQGATAVEIAGVGLDLGVWLTPQTFPREAEVESAVGFSAGGGDQPTSPPSV